MLTLWYYAKNISDQAQTMDHRLFASSGGLVSVYPVGLVLANGTKLTLQPGQIAKLPTTIWCEIANKKPWTQAISEEEWLALVSAGTPTGTPALEVEEPEAADVDAAPAEVTDAAPAAKPVTRKKAGK